MNTTGRENVRTNTPQVECSASSILPVACVTSVVLLFCFPASDLYVSVETKVTAAPVICRCTCSTTVVIMVIMATERSTCSGKVLYDDVEQ